MTVFKGDTAIKEFLEQFDNWLSESVTVYLLGGSAMTVNCSGVKLRSFFP